MKSFQEIVYIHLGKRIPFPIEESVINTRKHFKNTKITILTDYPNKFNINGTNIVDTKENPLGQNHRDFINISRQNRKFRDGFWMKASQRLFVLEDYLTKNQLDDVLHVENDCLISFKEKDLKIFENFSEEILIPRESFKRAVLPIMVIKTRKSYIKCLIEFNSILKTNPEMDEMEIFAKVQETISEVTNLPVIPSKNYLANSDEKDFELLSNNYLNFSGLFDPSIYGQYIFGQDPTNNRYFRKAGYRNPNTEISTEVFKWSLENDGEFLSILVSSDGVNFDKLYNLHVHGKYLTPLVSENYKHYVKIIDNANKKEFISEFAKELFLHNLIRDPKMAIELIFQWISILKRKFATYFFPRFKPQL